MLPNPTRANSLSNRDVRENEIWTTKVCETEPVGENSPFIFTSYVETVSLYRFKQIRKVVLTLANFSETSIKD